MNARFHASVLREARALRLRGEHRRRSDLDPSLATRWPRSAYVELPDIRARVAIRAGASR